MFKYIYISSPKGTRSILVNFLNTNIKESDTFLVQYLNLKLKPDGKN